MRVSDYATAILELIQNGMSEEKAFTGLSRVLRERGHERLYPKILRTLNTSALKYMKRDVVTITVAREEDATLFKENIKEAVLTLEGKETSTRVSTTITGGFIAENKEKRIDASYKKKLLTLYRSLVSS